MNFYKEWKNSINDIEKNKMYMKRFLSKDKDSLEVFQHGTVEELVFVCKFLISIPISNFLCCINEEFKCTSDMIIQYSNFNYAIIDVPRILKFSEKPLTFNEIVS